MSIIENQRHYSLHQKVGFSLRGSGPLYDYLAYQYNYFFLKEQKVTESNQSSLVLTINENFVREYDTKLKNGNEYFALDSNHELFIWSVGNKRVALDGRATLVEQLSINFESGFNRMKANLICELVTRLKFAEHDIALVHAACITKKGEAVLLPAWKGMGKTAACLKLVEAGYDFMADDRIWISASGEVYAYPRYVVIKDSNAAFFPQFTTYYIKIKQWLLQLAGKVRCINRSSLFQRIRRFLIPAKYFYIEDLYPSVKIVRKTQLGSVVSIVKKERSREISIESMGSSVLAAIRYRILLLPMTYFSLMRHHGQMKLQS